MFNWQAEVFWLETNVLSQKMKQKNSMSLIFQMLC